MSREEPPIVALHGNLGCAADWQDLGIAGLEAVDLWDYSHLSFSDFAGELTRHLVEESERPILAGYSLGGRLALHALAAYPGRWKGAVILSAHPGLFSVEERIARRAADELWAERAREMRWDEFLKTWNRQGVFSGEEVPLDRVALEPRREAIARGFENWSLGRQENLRPRLQSFAAPVLWLTGERDRKFNELGAKMRGVFPDCRHEVVAGHGHRLLSDEVAVRIESFLGELG
ncbi:MAG: alpha/beta fold hydrolase [Verrucomicrobiales bacterium]